ncbi:MAG: peptidyl-prolyl cis-trans isomerase [Oscillospiraceae bacterium]|nr:peptidyl-prolyl cis-trans isomerase [Oscillospiraceae bacterium]
MSKGKRLWLIPAALFILICSVAVWRAASDRFPKLEVSGFPVSREEYVRAMYQARNEVLSDHAAAGISLTDWSRETALGDPCALVAERATQILTEYYAVSTLAVERGYLADASLAAMERELQELNTQRQEAVDSGAIVTGMLQFSLEDYMTYRASSIRLQFTNDPENPEFSVTEEEILERYEADRDSLYRKPDDLELQFLLIRSGDVEAEELESLRQRALETGSLRDALAESPGLQAYFQEISVNAGTYSVYARSHGDILSWSAELAAGEISPVIRQEDQLCLIQCLSRIDHQYTPLEEVASVVVQSIRESRYDALIAQRMAATEVRGDLDALYRFTAEQLR